MQYVYVSIEGIQVVSKNNPPCQSNCYIKTQMGKIKKRSAACAENSCNIYCCLTINITHRPKIDYIVLT